MLRLGDVVPSFLDKYEYNIVSECGNPETKDKKANVIEIDECSSFDDMFAISLVIVAREKWPMMTEFFEF
jgi:hypothetical protein